MEIDKNTAQERLKDIYLLAKGKLCSCYMDDMPCAWEKMTDATYDDCPSECPIGEIRRLCNP